MGSAQLLARIRALWLTAFDPLDPAGSLPRIGAIAGAWITAAQAGAAAEATRYLSALFSNASDIPLPYVRPFSVPAGLVGSTASGSTVMSYLRQAPAVYFNRKGQGYSDGLAADSTLSWLNRTASSEPYRVANQTVNGNASEDDRYSGRCRRITRAGCCDFCTLIADRGYIPSHAGFAAHAHCRCTAEPEISSWATSRSSIARGRAAATRSEAQARREAEWAKTWSQGGVEGLYANRLNGFDDYALEVFKAKDQTLSALHTNLDGIRPEVIDRLSFINAAPDPYFQKSDALAYYQNNDRHISIRPSEFRPGSTKVMQDTIDHKWWTPDGNATGAERTISHELGHFLDYQLNSTQRYELTSHLAVDYGIETVTDAKQLISEYGGKNDKEMMAELWAEYKTSPNPRPPAQYAGQYIEDKLGPNPTPDLPIEKVKDWKYRAMGWVK